MEQIFILKESSGGIKSPSDLFKQIKNFKIDYFQENLIVFFLDTKNKLIKSEILFKGGLNSCIVDPKILFRKALRYSANSFIIAHNHPSKDLNPSDEDITIFETLKEAGRIINLECLDSIIFNKGFYYSINQKGAKT